jgi:predicted DsbA family dithiol-disulfide isomerase
MPDPAKLAMIRANFPALKARAAALGVEMGAFPRMGVDTRIVHEAAKFVEAEAPASDRAFHQAVYRAHFVDGDNIGDRHTILAVAERAGGIDVAALEASLDEHRYRDKVIDEEREAHRRGVSGVPYLFVGDRPLVVGFLPPADLARSLEPFL